MQAPDMSKRARDNFFRWLKKEFDFYGLPLQDYNIVEWDEDYIRLVRENGAQVEISGLDPMEQGVPTQYFIQIGIDYSQQRKAESYASHS